MCAGKEKLEKILWFNGRKTSKSSLTFSKFFVFFFRALFTYQIMLTFFWTGRTSIFENICSHFFTAPLALVLLKKRQNLFCNFWCYICKNFSEGDFVCPPIIQIYERICRQVWIIFFIAKDEIFIALFAITTLLVPLGVWNILSVSAAAWARLWTIRVVLVV